MKKIPKIEVYSEKIDKIIQEIKTAQNNCSSFTPLMFILDNYEDFNLLSQKIEKLPGISFGSFQIAPHLGKDSLIVIINVTPIASGDVY
jgi:hypothetical protein